MSGALWVRSHCVGEFVERGRDAEVTVAGFDVQFVVTAAQVGDEGVTADDHPCGPVGLESPHRPQPGLESPVVALHPIVRILPGVMERGRKQLLDDVAQRAGQIRDNLDRLAMVGEHASEEPWCRRDTYTSITWPC